MAYVITRSKGPMRYARRTSNGTSSTHSWQSPGHATWCTAFYLAPMRRRRELDPLGVERSRRRWRPRCFWPGSRFRASTAVCTHPRDVAEERRCSARHRRLGCEYRFVAPPDSLTEWAAIWRAGRRTYDAGPRGRAGAGLAMPDQDANHLQLCGGATSDAAGHDRGGITMIGRFRG
jgi:hypothetical protein